MARRPVEGSVYGVPLTGDATARVVVARVSPSTRGVVLGYFFPPQGPGDPFDAGLRAVDAMYVSRFGDLGIIRSRWPLLGPVADFAPDEWPIPKFAVRPFEGPVTVVTYDEQDVGKTVGRQRLPAGHDVPDLPRDGLDGYAFVEKYLANRLAGSD